MLKELRFERETLQIVYFKNHFALDEDEHGEDYFS